MPDPEFAAGLLQFRERRFAFPESLDGVFQFPVRTDARKSEIVYQSRRIFPLVECR